MKKEQAIKTINDFIEIFREDLLKKLKGMRQKDDIKIDYNLKENSVTIYLKHKKTTFSLNFYRYRTPDIWTKGTLNRTKDGKYIFYLDYDLMKEEYIKGELIHLQEIYDLGDIHVFQSSEKGFHVISFAKLTAKEYVEILENSSCDYAFKNIPRYTSYRNWVLRHFSKGIVKQPKYLYTLKRKTKRQHSLAHYKFIKLLYPKINQKINSDGIKELTAIKYATGSNVD